MKFAVTLPDGSKREFSAATTPGAIADAIGKRLGEAAVAAKIDDREVDLFTPIDKDVSLQILTRDSKEGLEVLRHSTAHLMAQALQELYPGTQLTIGPVIEDGFYYDIDCPVTLTVEDLPKIEKRMTEIVGRKLSVARHEFKGPQEAIDFFAKKNEKYKAELIAEFPKGEPISYYTQGEWMDLCTGPHVPNTGKLGHFKLLSVAGAYWRGNENNKMLQRIYGTTWATKKELDEYLNRLEEAKKRDHRKLGPDLKLFSFLPVAPAMPFYLPNGAWLFNRLVDFMRDQTKAMGFTEVICPQLMGTDLWKTSGHLDNYAENMFLFDKKEEGQAMGLKPMNCPGHCALFKSAHHSYRDLPVRYSEYTKLHRNERGGVTHGILRTRAFSQDDGHIYCTEDQVEREVIVGIEHTIDIYRKFGFNDVVIKLATRPEKFLGEPALWDKWEKALGEALTRAGKKYEILPGEGAFYGPKIEFHIKDAIGRFWQCGTIQLDWNLPQRFQLEYIDSESKAKQPVMIHRAILGSVERFMGILIEHHAGHMPFWISPVQVGIINVTEEQSDYAKEVDEKLRAIGLRTDLDLRYEKLGFKIREAQLKKTPLMIVLGHKEAAGRTLSVRKSNGETLNDLDFDGFKKVLEPLLNPGGTTH